MWGGGEMLGGTLREFFFSCRRVGLTPILFCFHRRMSDSIAVDSNRNDDDDDDHGSSLNSSELGTKDYWDSAYAKELDNYRDFGDEGTVWFGEGAVNRVVRWLENEGINKDSSVLDIGCGNGSTLLALATKGWRCLTGVDYSLGAVSLAATVASSKVAEGQLQDFKVIEGDSQADFTTPFVRFAFRDLTAAVEKTDLFDVVLDKGTFDAVSLCPADAEGKKRRYVDGVAASLKKDGVFSLTSCNWTEDELMIFFGNKFKIHDRIAFPTFSFGGKTGSSVTSLVLRLK